MSDLWAPWIELFGRLHPLVLHLPIGLLVGLAVLEGAGLLRRTPLPGEIMRVLVWLTAASAVLAAGTGYVLAREGANLGPVLVRHQQLGIALAIACVITAMMYWAAPGARPYRVSLLVSLAMLLPVGHLGGSMTHGDAFVTAPLARMLRATAAALESSPSAPLLAASSAPADVAENPVFPKVVETPASAPAIAAVSAVTPSGTAPDSFTAQLQPILAAACTDCHGDARQKGGLALHTLAALSAGGKSGPVFVTGKPEASELVRRLRLPQDDKKHMPPPGKPPLNEAQIRSIEAWIASGAPAGGAPSNAQIPPAPRAELPKTQLTPATIQPTVLVPAEAAPAPDRAALAALTEHLVHFEATAPHANLLCVNFAAAARRTDDAMAQRLLEPLLANLDTLSLSQCAVGDATAALLARAPRLRRIDLRGTATSDAGVRALCALPHLEELVLARTRITDSAVERLAAMPALRCVFVWSTGVTAKGLAELRTCKPKLYVNAGEFQAAATQESEPPIKLSSDAPEPGKPAAAPAAAVTAAASPAPPPTPAAQPTVTLQPVNTVCPVSGSPVDPKFAVVHKNRVIGFCCPNCPGQFWADPAKFEAKLPPLAALPVAGG